jgi:hypothetical protein
MLCFRRIGRAALAFFPTLTVLASLRLGPKTTHLMIFLLIPDPDLKN